MSENKRNIDSPDLDLAQTPDGNRHPTGHSTKEKHHVENAKTAQDNQALGTAGRKAGYGKGHTHPEGHRE
ncbi:MAG TPA: hypothetical protein VGD08_01185 [Stellaceae bacterium]